VEVRVLLLISLLACKEPLDLPVGTPSGPASDDVWDDRYVPVYSVTMAASDWESALLAEVPAEDCDDRAYLPVDVEYENPRTGEVESYFQVGMRFRGHSSLSEGQRWGFKLSFDEFLGEQDFHDFHNANFMGTEGDFSLLRERLAQKVMRDAGVPAPRVGHVQLVVNGQYQGVFPFPEEPDDDPYLDAHFDDDGGGLYKVSGYCGGNADFEDHGDDIDRYNARYEAKAGTEEEDFWEELYPLLQCASGSDEELLACLPGHADVQEWLTEMAVDMVLPDVDGLAGAGQNFMLYRDPGRGTFVVYPWDKDQAFSTAAAVSTSIWNLHPSWSEPTAFAQRVRRLWSEDFCAEVLRVAELADPAELEAEVDQVVAYLEEPMSRDPWYLAQGRSWGGDVGALREDLHGQIDAAVAEAKACSPP
jgi:spore coat protein CotH